MQTKQSLFSKFIGFIAKTFKFVRISLLNLAVFMVIVLFLSAIVSDEGSVDIKDNSALVLKLEGELVIQKRFVSPLNQLQGELNFTSQQLTEVLLADVLTAIERATNDNRIETIVLEIENLSGGGLDKLVQINKALEVFQAADKSVYVMGNYYTQNQYLLASGADGIFLHPMGGVMLEGYGRYKNYYKDALDKLNITPHIFRVGTFKSYVEPYIRNDMSENAKEANLVWTSSLWDQYKNQVSQNRDKHTLDFDETLDVLLTKLSQADGNMAKYAIDNSWVDELKTDDQFTEFMQQQVAKDDSKRQFRHVLHEDYLLATDYEQAAPPVLSNSNIAIVVAKGSIMDGRYPAGEIGGDSTADLIRKANKDDSVEALVLHVDSPGGSAFASEMIREQLVAFQQSGRPFVVSMSSVAASGGYWISTDADEIWAAPSTITGSIGVFGMFLTFDKALEKLGVYSDGVGTTEITGLTPFRPLPEKTAQIIQMSIERSYQQFIELVAASREMSTREVDAIAQGRVWTGVDAKKHGLVDHLGYLDDAIASAATLAGLDDYGTLYIERDRSPEEILIEQLFGAVEAVLPETLLQTNTINHPIISEITAMKSEFEQFLKLNDPQGIYSLCNVCQ